MKDNRICIKSVVKNVLGLSQGIIDSINETEDLRNYNLDSLSAVQLLAELEDEFKIEFDFDDLNIEKVTTLRNIYYLLEKYMGEDI